MTIDVAEPDLRAPQEGEPPRRRRAGWTILRAPAMAAIAGAAVWLAVARSGINPLSPLLQPTLKATALFLIGALLLARLLLGSRRDAVLADAGAAAVGLFCSLSVAAALHGTPWSLYGLYGDQQFRTEQITHFAATWRLDDFAYKGLPGYYPPLFSWLLGRLADLTGTAPWRMVHPFQVVMALVIPVVGYLFWRRLVTPWVAVGVTAVVSLLVANAVKPDEWIALAVVVPWWLDAFRDAHRPGLRRWPAWLHGIVAGLLVTAYTFYFLPVALATLVGLAVDWRRGRPLRPALVRGGWVVGVGLLACSVYWVPYLAYKLAGHPFYNTQFRWSDETTVRLPSPLELSVTGVVMIAGVGYLALRAYHDRLAESLAVLVGSVYGFYGLGFWLAALNHPILVFHAEPLLRYGLLAAGAVGAGAAARWLREREAPLFEQGAPRDRSAPQTSTPQTSAPQTSAPQTRTAVVVLIGATVIYSAAGTFVKEWISGKPIVAAHSTRLPDGSHPRYDPPGPNASTGFGAPDSGPPAERLYQVVMAGHPRSWRPVVISTREDLPTLYPMYTFLHWGSIYSNGFAQYRERAKFLDGLSGQRDPAAFARQIRDNPYGPIDVFVLSASGDRLYWGYDLDSFPNRMAYHPVVLDRGQFSPRFFTLTDVDGYLVAVYKGA